MANVRNANSYYVDATGSLTVEKMTKVLYVSVTATAASAVVVLQDEGGSNVTKCDLRVATSGSTEVFSFEQAPIVFPNKIKVSTLTNAIVTIVYTSAGGS